MRTEYIQSFCIGRTDLKRNSIKASQMVCGPAALKILDKHKHTATSTGIRKLQPKADQNHKLPYSPQARKHRFSKDSFLQITRTILKFLWMQGSCYFSQHSRSKKKCPCKPWNPTTALKVLFISSSFIMYLQSQKFHRILNLKWNWIYLVCHGAFIHLLYCVVFQLTWLMFLEVTHRKNTIICLKSI